MDCSHWLWLPSGVPADIWGVSVWMGGNVPSADRGKIEQMKALMNLVSDPTLLWDPEATMLVYANAAAKQLLENSTGIVPPFPCVLEQVLLPLGGTEEETHHGRRARLAGAPDHVVEVASWLPEPGEESSFALLFLTPRAEAFATPSHPLETLIAGLVHEVRNPLASIQLLVQAAMSEATRAEPGGPMVTMLEGYVGRLLGEIQRTDRRTRCIRYLVHRWDEHSIRYLPKEALESALLELSPMVQAKGVALEVSSAGDSHELVGLPEDLRQLLQALVERSLHAIRKQGRIRIQLTEEGDWIALSVRDNGRRVRQETLDLLQAGQLQPGPDGVALSLAYWITHLYSGQVKTESHDDRGTLVEVRWPAAPRAHAGGDS